MGEHDAWSPSMHSQAHNRTQIRPGWYIPPALLPAPSRCAMLSSRAHGLSTDLRLTVVGNRKQAGLLRLNLLHLLQQRRQLPYGHRPLARQLCSAASRQPHDYITTERTETVRAMC